jgi:hypothetical protein
LRHDLEEFGYGGLGVWCHDFTFAHRDRKRFFLEKEAKTFAISGARWGSVRGLWVKVFWFFFSKKNTLPSLGLAPPPNCGKVRATGQGGDEASMLDFLRALFRAPPLVQTPPEPAPEAPMVSLWADTTPFPPAPLPPARARYFRLRTGRGNLLAAGEPRVDMAALADTGRALIAVVPDDNRQLCFLMAPDLRPIDIRADGMLAVAISAFRMQTDSSAIRLRHPLSPVRFMAVTQPGQGAPDGCVIFDSHGRGRLDLFEPMEVGTAVLSEAFLGAAAELCAATARPYRAATLMEQLRTLAIRPALAEPLLRVLPREELASLARDVLDRRTELDILAEVLPQNVWAQQVLPALAAWRGARHAVEPAGVMTSPAADEFAGDPFEGYGQPQAGFVLTALARGQIQPRRGACVVATARNEGPYLLDWLAHHRALGFEHAFIYTNDNLDGSDTLLQQLAGHGVISLIHNIPGTHAGPQYKAYAHALTLLPQVLDYRWAAIIDLDEYIGVDSRMFGGIQDFLDWQETQPVDAIALCWLMFVAGRGDRWSDESTPVRFTRREAGVNQHVKSLLRPGKFWNSQAHYPHSTLNMPFIFRTEDGGVHHHLGVTDRIPAFAAQPTANLAWVSHYWLRSAPEALWKVARGHGDWKDRHHERHLEMSQFMFRSFVALAGRTDLVEDRRTAECVPGVAAQMEALLALPGIAETNARLKLDFGERLKRMAAAFVETAPAQGEPAEFAPFREVLRALA